MLHPIALQGTEIVRVAQLGSQLLEDGPVPLLPLASHLALEVSLEIGRDGIVVEQRVVDIEQEGNRIRSRHRATPLTRQPILHDKSRAAVSGCRRRALAL